MADGVAHAATGILRRCDECVCEHTRWYYQDILIHSVASASDTVAGGVAGEVSKSLHNAHVAGKASVKGAAVVRKQTFKAQVRRGVKSHSSQGLVVKVHLL